MIAMIMGAFVAALVLTGVALPILADAGTTTVDVDNDGVLCAKIGAGYSATASALTTEQYALIGETVSIIRTADQLHAYGVGIDTMAAELAITYDGANLTIGGAVIPCAWAFVPDSAGTYRYGDGGATLSIDDVYGAGTSGDLYFSIHGASSVKVGGIA